MVIIAIVMVMLGLFLPSIITIKSPAPGLYCAKNLKQIATAMSQWSTDHQGRQLMRISTNSVGEITVADSTNLFRYFQMMSNQLYSPKMVLCPSDSERSAANDFGAGFGRKNLSYFIGLGADETNPNAFRAGDRNLTNGLPITNGLFAMATNLPFGWTKKIHNGWGNAALADGSVQHFTSSRLTGAAGSGTNWLIMP